MDELACRIVSERSDVMDALGGLGLSHAAVEHVALAAVGARADTLPVDPVSAPGWFAYAYGVRHLRLQLRAADGWRINRIGNVESVVNDKLAIQLLFQNVDRACDVAHDPRAVSGKGAESRRQVAEGQGELFERRASGVTVHGTAPVVWVVCVEASTSALRAEVSCPRVFDGQQFDRFAERIFVVDRDLDPVTPAHNQDLDEPSTLDVVVNRKR